MEILCLKGKLLLLHFTYKAVLSITYVTNKNRQLAQLGHCILLTLSECNSTGVNSIMAFHISIQPCSPSLASFCLKWFCEKQLTRFAQCHVHTYMFHPYAISTLYRVLEELQVRSFKRYLFLCNSSHKFTHKRNELRYHCCLSQLYFIGH